MPATDKTSDKTSTKSSAKPPAAAAKRATAATTKRATAATTKRATSATTKRATSATTSTKRAASTTPSSDVTTARARAAAAPTVEAPPTTDRAVDPTTNPATGGSSFDASALVAAAQDALYIAVGFGVLAFQKAQVRRREVTALVESRLGDGKKQASEVAETLEKLLSAVLPDDLDARIQAIETKIDKLVSDVQGRLPDPAAALVGQVHDAARTARKQVLSLVS